jgi:ribonucleoside-diphosphate reductase alpha chain
LAQTISRVASTGYGRGQLNQLVVVQGGNTVRKAVAEAETARATEIDIEANVAEIGLLVAQAANSGADERKARARRAAEARLKGYEGDACGSCGNFTLVRNGTCLKCDTCGGTTGCS